MAHLGYFFGKNIHKFYMMSSVGLCKRLNLCNYWIYQDASATIADKNCTSLQDRFLHWTFPAVCHQ